MNANLIYHAIICTVLLLLLLLFNTTAVVYASTLNSTEEITRNKYQFEISDRNKHHTHHHHRHIFLSKSPFNAKGYFLAKFY